MKHTIRVVAAIAMIIGSGLVHGAWTSRWRIAPAVAQLAARLEKTPTTFGPWTMSSRREISGRAKLAAAGAAGYISRIYSNANTGQSVAVLMLSGLPGDITTHTPDACYPGAGFVLGSAEKFTRRYGDPARTAEFSTALATRGGANPSSLRIFWSWLNSKGWAAPDDARWAYASESALTKLYVVRETGGVRLEPKEDPCSEFLGEFLPVLDRTMSDASGAVQVAAN